MLRPGSSLNEQLLCRARVRAVAWNVNVCRVKSKPCSWRGVLLAVTQSSCVQDYGKLLRANVRRPAVPASDAPAGSGSAS